jgi:hypothetical protein
LGTKLTFIASEDRLAGGWLAGRARASCG